MKINEFIKEYTEASDKLEYVESHVTEKYVGYATKVARCQKVIDVTSSKEINGEKVYAVDSTARFMLYTLVLIESYTDIEIDYSQAIVCFDLLSENNVVANVLSCIPEREQKMFQLVFDMVRDDKYTNERELVSFIENKASAVMAFLTEIYEKAQAESAELQTESDE